MSKLFSLMRTTMHVSTAALWLAGYICVIVGIMIFAVCWEAIWADSADADPSVEERGQWRKPSAPTRQLAGIPRPH